MSYPLTVAEQIQIGQVSMYLSLTDVARKKFLQGIPYFDELLPLKIAMETDCLNWQYEINPSDTTLVQAGEYLYALCGIYAIEAQDAINTGGIVINPVTNVGSYLIVQKAYPQFVVGSAGAPMNAGDTVLTIIDSLIVPESLEGQVTIHVDGSEQGQQLLDKASSYTVAYSAGQFVITFNQGVYDGTLIMIDYPIKKTLVYQQGNTPASDTIYSATLTNVQTKTLVDTDGNIFTIPSGTQGGLNIELSGFNGTGGKLYAIYPYYVENVAGVISIVQGNVSQIKNTIDDSMFDNIVISGDNGLGGVKIVATGINTQIITLNAKFSYNSFNL